MAKKNLRTLLGKIEKEFSKETSQKHRTRTVNKKQTTFEYRATTIKKTLITLIGYVDSEKNLSQDLTTEEKKAAREYITSILKPLNKKLQTLTKDLKKDFKIAINSANASRGAAEKDTIITTRTKITINLMKVGTRDNYVTIQTIYKKHLDSFYQDFLAILKENKHEAVIDSTTFKEDGTIATKGTLGLERKSSSNKETGTTLVNTGGKAFNLEHDLSSSNINDYINEKVYAALEATYKDATDTGGNVTQAIKDELETLGDDGEFILEILKNVKDGKMTLFLGSQILNVQESKKEQAQMVAVQARVKKILEGMGPAPATEEGSDSLLDGVRKKAVKKIMKEFSTIKGVEITAEGTKIKESLGRVGIKSSSKKSSSKTIAVKRRPGAFPTRKKKLKKSPNKKRRTANTTPNLAQILGIIQQNLPKTVAQNMGPPGLTNRTGRFAGSVEATEIMETPQGFPSIGYTYMKRPYQTFETGYAQGSVQRDPRKLIDTSIREIAAGLAIGRFYTRRV